MRPGTSVIARVVRGLVACTLAVGLAPSAMTQPVYKCSVQGAVAYQSVPCPSGEPRKRPTVAELNEQRKREPRPAPAAVPPRPTPDARDIDEDAPAERRRSSSAFRCDGRTHCSKMTSCAEARFFLANCPNVAMDGDGDGVPCETQWCH